MIVDINVHWAPDSFYNDEAFFNACLRCIPRAYGEKVQVRDLPEKHSKLVHISRPKGYENLVFEPEIANSTERIKIMDKARVDKAILRWPIFPEWLTLELCRKANDAMYKTVREHPERFANIAIVPPWDDRDCIAELDRCVNDLGCVAVEVEAHYGNLYLDDEEFRPFFRKISKLDVPVIVHHTALPVSWQTVYDYNNLRRLFGRCVDQMTSVGRILYCGILDELPNLKFIHTMMGGGLFAFADLLTPPKSTIATDVDRSDGKPIDKVKGYLKNNIFCDITHAPPWGKSQLRCAVEVLGAENILFGSSYPLRSEWLLNGVAFIESLDISDKEKSLILGGNAERLFKLE